MRKFFGKLYRNYSNLPFPNFLLRYQKPYKIVLQDRLWLAQQNIPIDKSKKQLQFWLNEFRTIIFHIICTPIEINKIYILNPRWNKWCFFHGNRTLNISFKIYPMKQKLIFFFCIFAIISINAQFILPLLHFQKCQNISQQRSDCK